MCICGHRCECKHKNRPSSPCVEPGKVLPQQITVVGKRRLLLFPDAHTMLALAYSANKAQWETSRQLLAWFIALLYCLVAGQATSMAEICTLAQCYTRPLSTYVTDSTIVWTDKSYVTLFSADSCHLSVLECHATKEVQKTIKFNF